MDNCRTFFLSFFLFYIGLQVCCNPFCLADATRVGPRHGCPQMGDQVLPQIIGDDFPGRAHCYVISSLDMSCLDLPFYPGSKFLCRD